MSLDQASVDALQRIVGSARRSLQWLNGLDSNRSLRSPRPGSSNLDRPVFTVPSPTPLISKLVASGVDHVTAERMSDAFVRRGLQLKQRYDEHINSVTHAWMDVDNLAGPGLGVDTQKALSSVQLIFARQYKETLEKWVDEGVVLYRQRVLSLKRAGDRPQDGAEGILGKRLTSRQGTTPILEQAFAEEAYPSRDQKAVLAAKTGLEFRQINVWFQNRRSRAKKDGQELKRSNQFLTHSAETLSDASCSPSPRSCHTSLPWIKSEEYFGQLYHDARPAPAAPQPTRVVAASVNANRFQAIAPKKAPPHAYPTPYPPMCGYDAFPVVKSGSQHFETPWLREPTAPAAPQTSSSVNVEELITAFAKLRLDADSSSPGANEKADSRLGPNGKNGRTRSQIREMLTFSVVPARAPLPALVRTTTVTAHTSRTPRRRSKERYSPFGKRAPHRSASLVATSDSDAVSQPVDPVSTRSRRKTAGLPKRTPASSMPRPIVHSPSSLSRFSSTSSIQSSSSAASSSPSSYSSSSPGPVTPPQSPSLYPVRIASLSPESSYALPGEESISYSRLRRS